MFVVVTIKDLKYYLQRDDRELISLLMFVTLGPAYLYNSVAGCHVRLPFSLRCTRVASGKTSLKIMPISLAIKTKFSFSQPLTL